MEHIFGQVKAERRLLPIIFCGDRARSGADVGRKSGPENYEVKMAGVVREVDALALVGFAAGPLNLNAADPSRNGGEHGWRD